MKKQIIDEVEQQYLLYVKGFIEIETMISNHFDIPKQNVKDTIKRMLVETLNSEGRKYSASKYQRPVKMFFKFYLYMIYFLFLSVFGKSNVKEINSDIAIEFFSNDHLFDRYYIGFLSTLKKYKCMFVNTSRDNLDKKHLPSNIDVIDERSAFTNVFLKKTSYSIFKKYFFKYTVFHSLSREYGFNFVDILLRILRYIAIYEVDSYKKNIKVFISAGDQNFSALRYYIYKKNGIKNILLIQNALRDHGSYALGVIYSYCDYYFGLSKSSINSQPKMKCKNKIPVGSVALYNKLFPIYKNINVIENDIVIIEQLYLIHDSSFNPSTYLKCLKFMCKFKEKHRKYKVVYKTRERRNELEEGKLEHAIKVDNMLTESGIIIDDSDNSYETILKSNIVITYASTMAHEALALNKKVLNFNLDKYVLGLASKDEIGVLVTDSYKLFEEKILFLFNEDTTDYFLEKKEKYSVDSLSQNPYGIMDKHLEEIMNSQS